MRPDARRLAVAGWIGAVLVISLGAAGIVTGMDPPPGDGARPDLTRHGDAQVTAALDTIEADLRAMAVDVAALGTQARGALAALNGSDPDTVQAAIDAGDGLVDAIGRRATAIRAALDEVPLLDRPEAAYKVSAGVRERRDRLAGALPAIADLDADWARLTSGSLAAGRLAARLADHDAAVIAAAEQGRAAEYDAALATLDGADTAIAAARVQRDQLAATVDVSTLDRWLDLNAEYDAALRGLYVALRDVDGRVTDDVRDAIAAEQAAKDRLPPDARGLVLIMGDIGRGGMNRAVIAIEEARGALADALDPRPTPAP